MSISTTFNDCNICLEPITSDQNIIYHKGEGIKHPWHKECIVPWFKEHGACPACRESLNDHSLVELNGKIVDLQSLKNDVVFGTIISIFSTTLLMSKGYPPVTTQTYEMVMGVIALIANRAFQSEDCVSELTKTFVPADSKSKDYQKVFRIALALLSYEFLAIAGAHFGREVLANVFPNTEIGGAATAGAMVLGGTAAFVVDGMLKRIKML